MMTQNFAHIVEFDAKTGVVKIFRLFADGRKDMYTSTVVPRDRTSDQAVQDAFAKSLGEALIIDSPELRDWFNM